MTTTKGYRQCRAGHCRRMVRPGMATAQGGLCEQCCSIEGRLHLTPEEMHYLPGSRFEVTIMCAWCRATPVTTDVRCKDDVTPTELWRRVTIDCPSVSFDERYCCGEHADEARRFYRAKMSRARDSAKSYTGPKGKPFLTERLACDLNADRRCWICGADDLPAPIGGVLLPLSWTLDHAIPLGIGGWHAPFNCEVACWRCNDTRPKDGVDLCLWYTYWPTGEEFGSEDAARTTDRWPW